ICDVLDITVNELLSNDVSDIQTSDLYKRIENKSRQLGIPKSELRKINKKAASALGPTLLISKSIDDGYLNEFREVQELQRHIYDDSGTQLSSTMISNALTRRPDIIHTTSGNSRKLKYKFDNSKKKRG